MADVAAIRAAIKTNLATLTDLNVYDAELKKLPPYSVVVSWPDDYNPRATMAGDIDMTIPVRFEVPWTDDIQSDRDLMGFMNSAVAAIESDRTLGGACDDLSCGPFTNIGASRKPDETVVMQFVVPVEVLA